MENYTTIKEISTTLNRYYTSLGYCALSDSSIRHAIKKAEKAINPKTEFDKKNNNQKHYEASFLDEAFDYILKNSKFDLKKVQEQKRKDQNQVQEQELKLHEFFYTTLLLPCFDLLIGSSETLGITEKSFGKTAWFSMMNLYNLSSSISVEEFREKQLIMTLKKEIVKESLINKDDPDVLLLQDLNSMELQLTTMSSLLFDFERLIIKEEKNEDILFNIKDFNKITKRLYETHYFAPDKVMLPHFDEDAVNTFVETSDNSHVMSRKENFSIKYDAGNEDFWKKYS
jgi:hypothetical protein